MKVVNLPVGTNGAQATATQGLPGKPQVGAGSSLSYQVQLLLDSQVQVLLNEIAQMLQKLNTGLKTMPEQIANQAQTAAQQPLDADTAVPQGLNTLLNGPKTSAQNLKTYAQNLELAQTVKEYYPTDMPKAWNNLLDKLDKQLIRLMPNSDVQPEKAAEQALTNPPSQEKAINILEKLTDQLLNRFTTDSDSNTNVQTGNQQTRTANTLTDVFDQLVASFAKNLPEPDLALKNKFISVLSEAIQQTEEQFGTNTGSEPTVSQTDLPTVLKSVVSDFKALLTKSGNYTNTVTDDDVRQLCQQLLSGLPPQDGRIFKKIVSQLQNMVPQKLQTTANPVPTLVPDDTALLQQAVTVEQPETLPASPDQPATNILTEKQQEVSPTLNKPEIPQPTVTVKPFEKSEIPSPKNQHSADQQIVAENKEAFVLLRFAANRNLVNLSKGVLQQAQSTLKEMAVSMNRSFDLPNAKSLEQNALGFAIPLYIGDANKPYPAFIHVYSDKEQRGGIPGATRPDTWLRLCLSTENIGFVDLIFHIYGDNELDIRANFADGEAADGFKDYLSDIRSQFEDSPLNLSDISVNYV